jgi:hypothetical protein
VVIGRVGSDFGSGSNGLDQVSLIKKILRSRVGFESTLSRSGQTELGFEFLLGRVRSGFRLNTISFSVLKLFWVRPSWALNSC